MRTLLNRVPLVALLALAPATALGQSFSTALTDDFACNNSPGIGTDDAFPWVSNWAGDAWTTEHVVAYGTPNVLETERVSPTVVSTGGDFGAPTDVYENFLLTGHSTYADVRIRATVNNDGTGSMGLVVGHDGAGEYYACVAAVDAAPDCGGYSRGPGVYLDRIDPTETCFVVPPEVAVSPLTPPSGADFDIQLQVVGGSVTCEVDIDGDGVFGGAGDTTLSFNDPSPLGPGLAGLYAYGTGSVPETRYGWFDDVTVSTADSDSDFDGIPDAAENAVGSNPNSADSDGDGLSDREEIGNPSNPYDSDNDGTPDVNEVDSDNDTRLDWIESQFGVVDSDCDGVPDHRDTDSDGDSWPDSADPCPYTFGNTQDSDGDDLGDQCDPDNANPDTDGDGLADGDEVFDYGTDPTLEDTDGGGANDNVEVNIDGTDPLDPTDDVVTDTDGDGLADIDELTVHNTDPSLADTDGDGLDDGDEIFVHYTDPNEADSDGDGLSDGDEINTWNTDPNDTDTDQDTLTDGLEVNYWGSDPTDNDSDGDTLTDGEEVNTWGTNPASTDTDGDSLDDFTEHLRDTDGDGLNDATEADDDGDGVDTLDEDVNGNGDVTDDNTDATDPNGLGLQTDALPNYRDTDDDGDGIPTATEYDADGNGTADDLDGDGIPSYLDPDEDDPNRDTDGDGIPDSVEEAIGSDPFSTDSDGDGLSDADEVGDQSNPTDTDGDGFLDLNDPDDDGDGVLTSDELDANGNPVDGDGDGLPDHLDPDRDNDGVSDLRDPAPDDPGGDGVTKPKESADYGFGMGCDSVGSSPLSGGWVLLGLLLLGRRKD